VRGITRPARARSCFGRGRTGIRPASLALALMARGRRPQKTKTEKVSRRLSIALREGSLPPASAGAGYGRDPASRLRELRGSVSAANRARSGNAGRATLIKIAKLVTRRGPNSVTTRNLHRVRNHSRPSSGQRAPFSSHGCKCGALLLCRSGRRRCSRLIRSFGLPQKDAIGAVENGWRKPCAC
jgi:hypothetical protein